METVRFWDRRRLWCHGSTARAEGQLCLVLVVAPTAKRDVLDGCQSSQRIGPNVMELQESAFGAPVSVGGDEAALAAVTPPDPALDLPWDIPRRNNRCSKLPIRPGTDRTTCPRLRRRPQLRFLDLLEQQGDGAVEDRGRIAVRDLAAEKVLHAP